MAQNVPNARAIVLNSLNLLEKVYEIQPSSFLLQIFFNSKSNEIVDLFSEALPKEKTEITNLLNKIDPNNMSKYDQIVKGK